MLLCSIIFNVWLMYELSKKADECDDYKEKASYWLTKYNEK